MDRVVSWGETVGRWLLAATFFITPMVTLRPGESVTFGDAVLVLAVGLAGLLLILRRKRPDIPVWIWGGGGLLLISIALTVIWPPDSVAALVDTYFPNPYTSSLSTGARLILALIVLPVAAGILIDRWSTVSLAAWAWVAGVTISCLVAVLDGVFGTELQISLANNPDEVRGFLLQEPQRFVGLGVHPTSFSVTAAMVIPVVLARMTSPKRVLYLSPVLLVICFGIVLSGSRVAFLGALVVIALSLWLNPVLRRAILRPDFRSWAPLLAVGGLSLLLLFYGPPADKPEQVLVTASGETVVPVDPDFDLASTARLDPNNIASTESNETRIRFIEKSTRFFLDRPVVGYGFEWIEAAHNIYLQLLVSGGILALIGFLWVYLGYVLRGIGLRRRLSGDAEAIRIAAVVALIGYMVMGLVQTDLLDRYLYLPAGLILGLSALSLGRGPDAETGERTQAEQASQ